MDPKIILETALNRKEITAIEALLLMQEGDGILPRLLQIADEINRRLNGGLVTYVRGKTLYYTNICRAECSFCSFWRRRGQKSAFVRSPEEIVRQVRESLPLRQVTLQGGLNPDLNFAYHLETLRRLREAFPALHIQGYSPAEIHFVARRARISPAEALKRLREAGLDSLSGDSADILSDKVRKKICSDKLRTADWVEIVRTAHRLGIPSTATILYGHVEDEIYICEHLEIIKNLQKETGGFSAFEPIAFVPHNTPLGRSRKIRHPVPLTNTLRMVAIARIFFGRLIPHIQIDWTKVGLETAVRALDAGADEIGLLSHDSHEIRLPECNGRGTSPLPFLRAAVLRKGRTLSERNPHTFRIPPPPQPKKMELVFA